MSYQPSARNQLSACIRADEIVGDEGFWVGEIGRDAGGGDGFAAVDARGDFEVEVEELPEEVFLGGEAVGGEDGVESYTDRRRCTAA
jgi:hypothetical protein